MEGEEERWVTIKEAARYLSVAPATIYTYMDKGLLPYRELQSGGGRRILHSDLRKLLVQGLPPRIRGKKKSQPPPAEGADSPEEPASH